MKRMTLAALALTALVSTNASANYSSAHVRTFGPVPNAPSAHLTYNGGPMIQHVKIFLIFYSRGYQYKDQLIQFYQAITQSAHIDMLQEYDQPAYKIRRGSYLGVFEDTNANPSSITTVHPQTYLSGLITAKKVPAPDDDTLYMMYFPSNIDPDMPGQNGGPSCVNGGGYCAYHSSYAASGGQNVYFGVMPDTPDDCSPGCGPSGFTGLTDVSSHEMIEAMTDPDVGQNDVAWYDNQNGEIGDICATGASETGVVDTWTVQKEWSNELNDCVATNPKYTANDFSLTADMTVTVPQGGMTTAMMSLTKVSGTAETVALTATAPTGLTASFSPASISSDAGKSTLTISAGATAMIGMSKLTVKAAGMSATKTQDITVNVVAPPDMAMAQGGNGGNGGGGNGGNGTGGNGNNGGGGNDSGCSIGGGSIAGSWTFAGLVLLALAFRRRRSA